MGELGMSVQILVEVLHPRTCPLEPPEHVRNRRGRHAHLQCPKATPWFRWFHLLPDRDAPQVAAFMVPSSGVRKVHTRVDPHAAFGRRTPDGPLVVPPCQLLR